MLPWKAMSRDGISSGWPTHASSAVQAAAMPAFSAGVARSAASRLAAGSTIRRNSTRSKAWRQPLAHRVQPAQHVGIEQVPLAARANPRAAARPDLDQPLAGQGLDRLPQQVAADPSCAASSLSIGRVGLRETRRRRSAGQVREPPARRDYAGPWRRTVPLQSRLDFRSIAKRTGPIAGAPIIEPWSACSSNHPMIALASVKYGQARPG